MSGDSSLFDQLKASVSPLDYLTAHGIEPNRSSKIPCPWHEETTASCHVYTDRVHCFGCGSGGDVSDLAAALEGFSAPHDAAQALACRYGIVTGKARPLARGSISRAIKPPVLWTPYVLTDDERQQCKAMSEALAGDPEAIAAIAAARGWQPETIRTLALDPCLGLLDGLPVYIYKTGAKLRVKPLESSKAAAFSGAPFRFLFGKAHALWRADRIAPWTRRVCITEGETAAIALIDAGLEEDCETVVVATPGASTWRQEWAALFSGREVVIWPDADAPGEKHAREITASLEAVALSISVVPAPGTAQKEAA